VKVPNLSHLHLVSFFLFFKAGIQSFKEVAFLCHDRNIEITLTTCNEFYLAFSFLHIVSTYVHCFSFVETRDCDAVHDTGHAWTTL
jgi:hypothetical protein